MNRLHKKSFLLLVVAGLALVFSVFNLFLPKTTVQKPCASKLVTAAQEIDISVENAGSFSNDGLYLTRPDVVSADNIYRGTISTEALITNDNKIEFYPTFTAMVRQNDHWVEADSNYFWKEETDGTNFSVVWCLRETAPAAVYCIRCSYDEEYGGVVETESIDFEILYQGDWNYVNVTNNNGERRITNFAGGDEKTLPLNITFNGGAGEPDLYEKGLKLSTGTSVGELYSDNCIVSTSALVKNIVVKTVSGKVYDAKNIVTKIDKNVNNRVEIRFLEPLEKDVYIVQFSANADNRILGQFIIDNSGMKGGVNLSQIWVILMIFGGLLALGASSAYLVPLFIVKINESRVQRENERIARMKNPEAYANNKKKSIKEIVDKIIYNIKTPVYKRKKEEKENENPAEEKVYSNRFTEMLRERQEKRDFMRENNVTSAEMEKMKEIEAALAADEANSFASLRDDDDDEIATFHAAEDEISTLETGAYMENGTRFAKLDSMNDDDGNSEND